MLTYHVAPRFDIAAKGGPLKLGTVVADLATVVPLNGGVFHLQVPDDLPYEPVIQTDFKDTLMAARSLNANAWLKFLGLPVGASASIENSRDLESGVECDSVTTTYFDDPAETYIRQVPQRGAGPELAPPLQGLHGPDLHVVTGLKWRTATVQPYHGAQDGGRGRAVRGGTTHADRGRRQDWPVQRREEEAGVRHRWAGHCHRIPGRQVPLHAEAARPFQRPGHDLGGGGAGRFARQTTPERRGRAGGSRDPATRN